MAFRKSLSMPPLVSQRSVPYGKGKRGGALRCTTHNSGHHRSIGDEGWILNAERGFLCHLCLDWIWVHGSICGCACWADLTVPVV